jgi:hypothetical protein
MSGGPICAITEPSTNSTKECITDCGCTTTSIWNVRLVGSICGLILVNWFGVSLPHQKSRRAQKNNSKSNSGSQWLRNNCVKRERSGGDVAGGLAAGIGLRGRMKAKGPSETTTKIVYVDKCPPRDELIAIASGSVATRMPAKQSNGANG